MAVAILAAACHAASPPGSVATTRRLLFVSTADNDIYRAASSATAPTGRATAARFDSVGAALASAAAGDALLVMAQGYPSNTTQISAADWERVGALKIPAYVEFPAAMPDGTRTSPPKLTVWERAVVAPGAALGSSLPPLRLLTPHKSAAYAALPSAHGARQLLVLAKVAGYDTAVDGLPKRPGSVSALLSELPGTVLVASTQLSQCRTRRFSPNAHWLAVWQYVLARLAGAAAPQLRWEPTVRPAFGAGAPLPPDAELAAMERAVEWYNVSGMLVAPERLSELVTPGTSGVLPCGTSATCGSSEGQAGVLEGFSSDVDAAGSQPQATQIRADCTAETAMAFAARHASARRHPRDRRTAINLLDFAWVHSGIQQPWNPPTPTHFTDTFGLIAWTSGGVAYGEFYKDDTARGLLGGIAVSGFLQSDRWLSHLAAGVLGNLRITGQNGFGPASAMLADIHAQGWRSYYTGDFSGNRDNYSPHYQCYLWAVYFWAYARTGYAPLLDRGQRAVTLMMERYPAWWVPTANGIAMQRARMLLPLAWLVRVNDTALHRSWLHTIYDGLAVRQDPQTGAIREEVTAAGWGRQTRVPNNADYGTFEAPLNQDNDDPVSDFLYTSNFALLGLHEAAAVTGNVSIRRSADALAAHVVRIQARSEEHPELDGSYARAFDYRKWEVWASDADLGWGAWSVETGWTQSWLSTVLALRTMNTTLWDLGARVDLAEDFNALLPVFFYPEPPRPCLDAPPGATEVSAVISSNATALCARPGQPVHVNYTGAPCGAGKLVWTAMAALDPAKGLDPAACRWTAAGESGAWRSSWTGSCGVGPAAVPSLPDRLC
eukprot:TRINITY_DN15711_c0_g2_i1.p1 TRINITY_DN15711_c0_g2~~TRINITY_DN15711_c0_g2_i1.p1  ORF type:complete len:834 (+),score=185.28 TRINITY_DN15711_c0_g2_i1:88-2589(+)